MHESEIDTGGAIEDHAPCSEMKMTVRGRTVCGPIIIGMFVRVCGGAGRKRTALPGNDYTPNLKIVPIVIRMTY